MWKFASRNRRYRLGFIGMTAVSTLAVLLPTVTGRVDPEAGQRLRRDLPWAAAGTLLVAVGSGRLGALAWVGAGLCAIPLLRMGTRRLRLYQHEILTLHGAAPPLATALLGFGFCIALGAIAPIARTSGSIALDPAAAFAAGFLLPLVSGAASQLLPVWLRPNTLADNDAACALCTAGNAAMGGFT